MCHTARGSWIVDHSPLHSILFVLCFERKSACASGLEKVSARFARPFRRRGLRI